MKRLVDLLHASKADKVPAGWYNPSQFAKREGFAGLDGNFYRAVNFGLKNGFVQVRKFKIKTGLGIRSVSHYRRIK